MVRYMSPFDELEVVDLRRSLRPFESILVGELHAWRHKLVSTGDEDVLRDLRVIALAHEA